MNFETVYSITGKVMIKDNSNGRTWMSLVEDNAFRGAIEGLYQFVLDNNADADMAYDWVCDQVGISSFVVDTGINDKFVVDTPAWDMFYSVFDQARQFNYV
jgi:hypothetical protein